MPRTPAPKPADHGARKAWTTAAITLGTLPLSFVLHGLLSDAPGPSSAPFVLFIALVVAFVAGRGIWSFFGDARDMLRKYNNQAEPEVSSGSFAFVPSSALCTLVAGVAIALLDGEWMLRSYAAVGLIHGLALWRMARAGWIYDPGRDLESG